MLQEKAPDLLHILASYVPFHILRRAAQNPAPLTGPVSEQLPAAVLFADISGFTALSVELARQGPVGAEELGQLLNTYLGELIDIVTAHGGDVVKFAGDGLIALWPATAEADIPPADRLATAACRAAQCALEAQKRLHAYQVAPGVEFSIKIGLGAGDVLAVHLGGEFNRWEFLVTGAPVVQAGQAEKLARPGQVVISPEMHRLLGEAVTTEPVAGAGGNSAEPRRGFRLVRLNRYYPLPPSRQVDPPPAVESILRHYIPGAILARLDAGQYGWLAELRRVTVIFINLPELNYNISLEQAQAIMRALQRAVYRFEGSISKLGVDEKGVMLLAAMGLPPLAHEDDPTRGVQAALAMQAEMQNLGLHCSIGVTTGQVFCGSVGNETRREYTIHGASVNLAARLMQAAGNGILCDETTCQAARFDVVFDTLPPIQVKGQSQPVQVFRPVRTRQTAQPDHLQIVNRKAEQRQLQECLIQLSEGQSRVVIIEGDTGIGKSRLLDELAQLAKLAGMTVLMGQGDGVEKSTLYYAWRPVFTALLGLDTLSGGVEEHRQRVLVRLRALPRTENDPDWFQLAPLLNPVLGLNFPENDVTRQMTGKVRADNTHDLLIHLLRSQITPPYVIILDDAHWLDSASLALASTLVNRLVPLLLAVATRPMETVPPEFKALVQHPGAVRLQLTPLSEPELAALVAQRLGVRSVPEGLTHFLHSRSEGNPFFGLELALALRDTGLIQVEDGICRLSPQFSDFSNLYLPDTIQGIITSRIDRLNPGPQFTLKVASVIGRTFLYSTLHDVHPIPTDREKLPAYLDTLTHLDITLQESQSPQPVYAFRQLTIRDVAYNMLLYSQRRILHRAVAQWFERTYSRDLSPVYALLAHHWLAAEEYEKAVNYLEKAGQQALLHYANEEAVRFFSQAIDLYHQQLAPGRTQTDLARWQLDLGRAYINWARLSEGRVHLEKGLALLGFAPPPSTARLVGGLVWQVGGQLLRRWLKPRVLGWRKQEQEAFLRASSAYEGLASAYYFAGDDLRTLYAAFRALNLAEAAGSSAELARSYALVGVILSFVPLHRLADSYCRRALDMASQFGDLPAQAWVALLVAVYYTGVARWLDAAALYEEVMQIADSLGDHSRWHDAVGNLAALYYFRGQFQEAFQSYNDMLASTLRQQDAHNRAWALRGRVHCLLVQNQLDEAASDLETIQTILADHPEIVDEPLNVDLLALRGLTAWRQGQPEPARQAALQAVRQAKSLSPNSYLSLPGYEAMVETLHALCQHGIPCRSERRQALKALRSFARVFPIGQPYYLLWQGNIAWDEGHPATARRKWAAALAHARKLDMSYVEAVIHYHIGRRLPTGETRLSHLERAEAGFARLQARYGLSLVREVEDEPAQP